MQEKQSGEKEEKGEGKGRREGAGGRGSEEWDGGGSERGAAEVGLEPGGRSGSGLGALGGCRRSGRGTPRAAEPSFRGEGQGTREGRRDSSVNRG